MERTFLMVKPDGVARGLVGEVIARIERRGLKIVAMKMLKLSKELAEKLYAEHVNKPFYRNLVSHIISGPCVAIVVEGSNAVEVVRAMIGSTDPAKAKPGTIRGDFALDTGKNIVHAADSIESARREISLFFGNNQNTNVALG